MNNTPKRPRGRPRGSGKNDTPLLQQVAELMAEDPKLRKTTAIKRVLARTHLQPGEMESTVIRRLQHKWEVEGPGLLAETRQRRSAASRPSGGNSIWPALTAAQKLAEDINRMTAVHRNIARMINPIPPEVREAFRFMETHQQQIREMQEAMNSNALRKAVKEMNRVQDAIRRLNPFAGL